MSQREARRAFAQLISEVHEIILEPYVVGPAGLGVLRLDVSNEISAYVSFAYFPKYQTIASYLGFGYPSLKSITDELLVKVGMQLGVTPTFNLSIQCPAILFPLEYFLRAPNTRPHPLAHGAISEWFTETINKRVIGESYGWLKNYRDLFEFLSIDRAPFLWMASGIRRRLAQVVYLARKQGIDATSVLAILGGISCSLDSEGDFHGHDYVELAKAMVNSVYQS